MKRYIVCVDIDDRTNGLNRAKLEHDLRKLFGEHECIANRVTIADFPDKKTRDDQVAIFKGCGQFVTLQRVDKNGEDIGHESRVQIVNLDHTLNRPEGSDFWIDCAGDRYRIISRG
jgi:hypothetical protein